MWLINLQQSTAVSFSYPNNSDTVRRWWAWPSLYWYWNAPIFCITQLWFSKHICTITITLCVWCLSHNLLYWCIGVPTNRLFSLDRTLPFIVSSLVSMFHIIVFCLPWRRHNTRYCDILKGLKTTKHSSCISDDK